MGHGSVPVTHSTYSTNSLPADPFYIVVIRYPMSFSGSWTTSNGNQNCYFHCLLIPFTLCVTALSETSRQLWKCTDFLGKAQVLLKFHGKEINCCELNVLWPQEEGVGTVQNWNHTYTSFPLHRIYWHHTVTFSVPVVVSRVMQSWVSRQTGHVVHGF